MQLKNHRPEHQGATLQEQISQKLKNVYIDNEFQITLAKNMFVDADEDYIDYELFVIERQRQTSPPNWLLFDKKTLTIKGKPPSKYAN